MWTRRQFLVTAGGAAVGVAAGAVRTSADAAPTGVQLTAQSPPPGHYLYLPFEVPKGVNRIDVSATKSNAQAKTGIGLFDHRGAGYQSPGFRGIYGEERAEFHVASDSASEAFLPGPIVPGEWTVIVPVFPGPTTQITVDITFRYGPQRPARPFEPAPDTVIHRPGWYRGDLHAHTPHSSDAWSSGSALTPRMWAEAAVELGLDFVAVTDHNVVSQNLQLRSDSRGLPVLLLAGEEMTNWFHGHATVSGIDPGDWLDWRQTPQGLPLPSGEGGARITEFLRDARSLGGFVSAAHPFGAHLSWQFLPEGVADPAALPDALEVWTGQWQPDDEAALHAWDALLVKGARITANGGSDMHGLKNSEALLPGTPTTVVWASSLSRAAVLDALRRGHCFVNRAPDAGEIYLSARGSSGQQAIVGDTVRGASGEGVEIAARVRGGGGMRLSFVVDGVPRHPRPIESDDQTEIVQLPIGSVGYVRAELRRNDVALFQDPSNIRSSRADMECFTNPIFLEVGEPAPTGRSAVPPPPPRPQKVTQRHMLDRFGMGDGSGVPVSASRCAACHGHDHG